MMWVARLTLLAAAIRKCTAGTTHQHLSSSSITASDSISRLLLPRCAVHPDSAYNSSHVLQTLWNQSLSQCCDLCSADRACSWFNWHPVGHQAQPVWCQLLGDDVHAALAPVSPLEGFQAGEVSRHVFCSNETDCSLAGECVNGMCQCDGWSHGDHCEVLNLEPADSEAFGYRNDSGYNSWGGASIQDPDSKKWYLFVSQIGGKCSLLGHWVQRSEGVRLVSDSPTGPWEFDEVILPSFAHNVKPFRAPDGTWLIYFIGRVNNSTATCINAGDAGGVTGTPSIVPHVTAGPIMVASAKAVNAPAEEWTIHGPLVDSYDWHTATNPTVVFGSANSPATTTMVVSRGWRHLHSQDLWKTNMVMRAPHWSGPFGNVTQGYNDSIHNGEDPDIFRTKRGWHMLNHNIGLASTRIWFSKNGVHWQPAHGGAAFPAQVNFTNGTTRELCWRQRPQVVFAEDGLPGWLWTGVGDGGGDCTFDSNNTLPSWTLAQKIGRR